MKKTAFQRRGIIVALLLSVLLAGSPAVFAQGATDAAVTPVLHYASVAIGLGLIVIGAAVGIGKIASAAVESIARQPSAAAQITSTGLLPIFLLEGCAILAVIFAFLILLLT
ncbi:MAG: ATP synthase F0 subunit C [Acidobacteria bacterium]|nr:ATP synthase F0 subunit C [Acidobacteriota bacterium]